jgi:general secretion pathway protein K
MARVMKAAMSLFRADRRHSDGFIVVTVLWMLGALAALVSIYAVYVINTATGFTVYEDRFRTEALVSAALELTAYRQFTVPPQQRLTHGQFDFRLGGAAVTVAYRSEAARIDLNAAPKPLLAGLFHALGARPEDAERYANRVIEWRTPRPKGSEDQGGRVASQSMAGTGDTPRAARFPHVGELSLVREVPLAMVERALPFLTVHSGKPQVNVLEAAPEVIAALPGMTPDRVRSVLTYRQAFPQDGKVLLAMLGTAQQYGTTEGSKALRVSAQVAFDKERKLSSEVVILLFDNDKEPFSILSWRDGLDGLHAGDAAKTRLR